METAFNNAELKRGEFDLRASLRRDPKHATERTLIADALAGEQDPHRALKMVGQLLAIRAGDTDAHPEALHRNALGTLMNW